MMKTRKDNIIDIAFMLAGAAFTTMIIASRSDVEISLGECAIYAVAGCAAGYALREVALRVMRTE